MVWHTEMCSYWDPSWIFTGQSQRLVSRISRCLLQHIFQLGWMLCYLDKELAHKVWLYCDKHGQLWCSYTVKNARALKEKGILVIGFLACTSHRTQMRNYTEFSPFTKCSGTSSMSAHHSLVKSKETTFVMFASFCTLFTEWYWVMKTLYQGLCIV